MEYGHHYMGSGTCQIANRQDDHSNERIVTDYNKENYHISTLFNFSRYALTPCLQSNTKALHIPNYDTIPNISKIEN